jgi:hypothetical protein
MSKTFERYECIMEPNGSWMVWDKQREAPALYRRNVLIGLPHYRAVLLCSALNGIAGDSRFQSLAS